MQKMISIIIPFRDKTEFLSRCVSGILQKTTFKDYEIILVDNNSQKKETFDYLFEIKKNEKIKVLEYLRNFNFSAINNFAVEYAEGEFLLFY